MALANTKSILRIGAIGVDSSHLPEFTRRINELNDAGQTPCRVTQFFDQINLPGGKHDMPAENVRNWKESTAKLGVHECVDLDQLLDQVDGVMVLSLNGKGHMALAKPALSRSLPTYIDKPLTCSLAEAKTLLAEARRSKARCYSASSLRFAVEIPKLDREKLGDLKAIDAYGPGEINESMPGLFYYGVHTIEMVDAIWGPGVKRISAIRTPNRDLADLDYHDGRYARLRLDRKGSYAFGATVHGDKGVQSFGVDFAEIYNRLVQGMVRFFEGGPAPVGLRDIVENIAVMEAGNTSIPRDGEWVDVETIE
jgi:predicted dehydrogenase